MKKLVSLILFFVVLTITETNSQPYKDSWGLGFGITSPRLMGDLPAENVDFGGHLNVTREFNEFDFMRFRVNYLMFTGNANYKNNTIAFGFDYARKLVYCGDFNLYMGIGGSMLYFTPEKALSGDNKARFGEVAAHIIAGGYYSIDEEWVFKTELNDVTVSTDRLDGVQAIGSGGLFGGGIDSYITLDFGLVYFFDRGEKSEIVCDMYEGIKTIKTETEAKIDYDKIEAIIQKYASKPAVVDYDKIESIVKKNAGEVTVKKSTENWVLVGINFDFNSSNLRPESYSILSNAAQVLLMNPEIRVEIQGHTDNIGSADANKKLSQQRAEMVKKFLISKGVSASRLSTVGYGSANPIADNKTADGRMFNRRIEFRVIK